MLCFTISRPVSHPCAVTDVFVSERPYPTGICQLVSPSTVGWRANADLPNTHLSDDRSVVSQPGCSARAAVW